MNSSYIACFLSILSFAFLAEKLRHCVNKIEKEDIRLWIRIMAMLAVRQLANLFAFFTDKTKNTAIIFEIVNYVVSFVICIVFIQYLSKRYDKKSQLPDG